MKIALIITAAGKGLRFGNPEGKMLVPIEGKPMLLKTLLAFSSFNFCERVIATSSHDREKVEQLLGSHGLLHVSLIPGGDTRKKSVQNAIQRLGPCDAVMIHDGARPYVSPELIQRLIDALQESPAAIPIIPISDTLKRVKNKSVLETVDRSDLYCVQTPQAFHIDILRKAYAHSPDFETTDEAGLIEKLGVQVSTVEGDSRNIKITVPDDIQKPRASHP